MDSLGGEDHTDKSDLHGLLKAMKDLNLLPDHNYSTSNLSLSLSRLNNLSQSFTPWDYWDVDPTSNGSGKRFYGLLTPWVILIGVFGNVVSTKIFLSRAMRRRSASLYLAALSISDLMVLLTYVLPEWLNKGLPFWPGNYRLPIIATDGVCQTFHFCSYTFRFVSVWIIVAFTCERYVAVCKPLHQKSMCTRKFTQRLLVAVFLVGCLISVYKPIFSGVTQYPNAVEKACTGLPEYVQVNNVLEIIFGLLITLVPYIVIITLNSLILKVLLVRDTVDGHLKVAMRGNRLRLELTLTLLAISSCFLVLNIPYFVVWVVQRSHGFRSDTFSSPQEHTAYVQKTSQHLSITRSIFYINYSINFFLYCLTGTYYRTKMRDLFRCGRQPSASERDDMNLRSMNTNTSVVLTVKNGASISGTNSTTVNGVQLL